MSTDIITHVKTTEEVVPWECYFGMCSHYDGDCQPKTIDVCSTCVVDWEHEEIPKEWSEAERDHHRPVVGAGAEETR